MIDLITVVFQQELNFLKVQAQSIELYIQQADLGNIYVVVNDDDSVVDLIDPRWWGINQAKVKVISYSCWNYSSRINGWENQQLCKLLAAGSAEHEWSMSLDAKTWFVQPVDLTKLFDDQGRVTAGTVPVFTVFDSSKEFLEKYYAVSMPNIIGPQGVPFVFHTATVKELINSHQDFTEFFQTNVRYPHLITEFHLYSSFVLSRDTTYEHLYNKTQYYTCCNIADSDVDNFDQHYARMLSDKKLLTASIHRRAYPLLNSKQLINWTQFLLQRGLNIRAILGEQQLWHSNLTSLSPN